MTTVSNPFDILVRQNLEILERLRRIEGFYGESKQPVLPKYFNIDEIMEMTSWSRATVYGKTHRRELPVIKAGKRLLFPAEQFMQHMESLKRPIINPKYKLS